MSVLSTTNVQLAAQQLWDVIVIGAGPAGSIAARELAQLGKKTLLVERKQFPREKVCGACINARALSMLNSVGLDQLTQQLGAIEVREFILSSHGRVARLPLPGGVALSRAAFDTALTEEAIHAGAQFLSNTTALVLPDTNHSRDALMSLSRIRQVELTQNGEKPVEIETQIVIAADGLGHPSLQRCSKFTSLVSKASHIGLGASLETCSDSYPAGAIFMGVGKQGYVGLVRLENSRLNIAAAVTAESVKSSNGPSSVIEQIIHEAGLPDPGGLSNMEWHGTPPLTRRSKYVAADGIFLIGDAASYVEPFTGEGISGALSTGISVVPFIQRALQSNSHGAEFAWSAAYKRLIHRRFSLCRQLTWTLRHPTISSAVFTALRLFPGLSRPIVRQLNSPLSPIASEFA